MFVLFIVLVALNGLASGYRLQQVEGLCDRTVLRVSFDSKGNVYANTVRNQRTSLIKLNPQNEILWEISLPGRGIYQMLINSQEDVYLTFFADDPTTLDLAILKSGSTEITKIGPIQAQIFFLIDDLDNVYFCTDNGIQLLRPNSTTPTPIRNLEQWNNVFAANVIDHDGNIFIAIDGLKVLNQSIALITKEASQADPPYAEILPINEPGQFTEQLLVDDNNDLWIATTSRVRTGHIKKLSKGVMQNILDDTVYDFHYGVLLKDNILIIARTNNDNAISIYYISVNDYSFINIPELTDIPYNQFSGIVAVPDSEANIYLRSSTEFTPELGPIILIKRNETSVIPIAFDSAVPVRISEYLLTDSNDNLWILSTSDGLYSLKKGETTAQKVSDDEEFEIGFSNLARNPITDQVLVTGYYGIFMVVDN